MSCEKDSTVHSNGFEDEEVSVIPRMWVTSRRWERQESGLIPRTSRKECRSAKILTLKLLTSKIVR